MNVTAACVACLCRKRHCSLCVACYLQSICLGDGWCAAATDKQLVRIFTLGGVQRDILSVAGPIVAVAGHMHQLLIVYHKGMGKIFDFRPNAPLHPCLLRFCCGSGSTCAVQAWSARRAWR